MIFAVACGAETEMFRADVPIEAQHRSMILAVRIGEDLTVSSLAISDQRTITPINARFSLEEEVEITALLYDATLAELGLAEGTLSRELDPERQRSLPDAEKIAQLTIRDRAPSEWSDAQLPPLLDDFRITAPDRCGAFTADVVSLGIGSAPTFAMALDDRWVMIGTSGHEVFFADSDRSVVVQSELAPIFSGYVEEGGTIWLGGARGVVYRATFSPEPRLSLAVSSTVSSREDIISLVGPPGGVPREQFALTTDRGAAEQWGAFEWFDGTTWRTPGLRRNTPHDATWVAPGFGLFASFYRDALVYGIRDGAETSITVDSVVFGSVLRIEQMPGLGLVAGTSGGEVHLLPEGGTWRSIAAVNVQEVGALHRYPGGIVYLAGNSMIRWVEPNAVCDENVIREDRDSLKSIAVLGEDVIVPLQGEPVGEQSVAWYARTR